MKKLPQLLGFALVAAFAPALTAATLVYDSFETYPSGLTLNGNNGGLGWTDAWVSSAVSSQVVDLSLDYNSGSISISGGSKVMQVGFSASTDNSSYQTTRTFETYSASTDTIYYSFLIQSPTLGDGDSDVDYFSIWLNEDKDFGLIIRDGDFRSTAPGVAEKSSGVSFVNNQTYLVVVKVSSSDGINYDTNEVFINPTTLTEPETATVTQSTSTSTVTSISSLGVRFALFEANTDGVYLDRLVVTDNWADAVATTVPEPKSSYLVLLAVLPLGYLFMRRRSRR